MVRIRSIAFLLFVVSFITCGSSGRAEDWTQWRGQMGDNHANADSRVPAKWDLTTGENVLWKQPLPGRGHSTPIFVGDAIYLTTADQSRGTQSVLKLSRSTGEVINTEVIHKGGMSHRIHGNNSHASPSAAWDGSHVFVTFHTADAIWLTALTEDLTQVWQRQVSNFKPRAFQFGYGASPIVEEGLVIVAAEYDGPDAGVYAFDAGTGRPVWKHPRKSNLSFASPIAATIAGQRLLLLAGGKQITALDPTTGRTRWAVAGAAGAVCGTCVVDGRKVLVSGGYPEKGTVCVNGAGESELIWENRTMCYEQSLLAINGYVFAVTDNGIAYCWRTLDGKEMWKERLFGGGISASPLLVGKHILVTTEAGDVFVIAAIPDRFDLQSQNTVGNSAFATPVVLDNRIYFRAAEGKGEQRQEFLVAIGRE